MYQRFSCARAAPAPNPKSERYDSHPFAHEAHDVYPYVDAAPPFFFCKEVHDRCHTISLVASITSLHFCAASHRQCKQSRQHVRPGDFGDSASDSPGSNRQGSVPWPAVWSEPRQAHFLPPPWHALCLPYPPFSSSQGLCCTHLPTILWGRQMSHAIPTTTGYVIPACSLRLVLTEATTAGR
jgi:hypothetical protein